MRPALAAVSLALATACGGGGAATAPVSSCQAVSPALVERITRLAPAGSGFAVTTSAGTKATSKASTYWVGLRFTARSEEHTGIWAVGGGLDGKGTLLAVDAVAQQFSDATDADTSASKISKDSGREVLACF